MIPNYSVFQEDEKYDDIIKIISNHIESANIKAKSRKTRNENEKMDVAVK